MKVETQLNRSDMKIGSDLEFAFLETATETLRALAHPQRIQIVDMLFHAKQLSVTDIHSQLDIEQAVASHPSPDYER